MGGGEPTAARTGQAGNLQLSGFHPHLWEDEEGLVYGGSPDRTPTGANEAQGGQGRTSPALARPSPRCRPVATLSGDGARALRLLRPHLQPQVTESVLRTGQADVVQGSEATKPKIQDELDEVRSVANGLSAPQTDHPSILARSAWMIEGLSRGAGCPNGARPDPWG